MCTHPDHVVLQRCSAEKGTRSRITNLATKDEFGYMLHAYVANNGVRIIEDWLQVLCRIQPDLPLSRFIPECGSPGRPVETDKLPVFFFFLVAENAALVL